MTRLVLLLCLFASTVSAGTGCKTNADCDVLNSICLKEKCSCPPDSILNGDQTACLQVAEGYGSPCTDSLQCSYTLQSGGACKNGTCFCEEGFHYLRGRCWKTSGLFEKCSSDDSCFVVKDFEASSCNDSNVCVCSEGYYQREYSSCRRISKNPGDPCALTLDCQYGNSLCLKSKTCGYNGTDNYYSYSPFPVKDVPTNIQGKEVGQPCKRDGDCIKNAHCSASEICQCKTGFYTENNATCLPELGSSCTSDDECGKYAFCRKEKGWCACLTGYVALNNSRACDKMSRFFNWSCLNDDWCLLFGPEGMCVNKRCVCSSNSRQIDEFMYCWKDADVGGTCHSQYECGADTSSEICNTTLSQCQCVGNNHESTDKKSCRPNNEQVGEPCSENDDCVYPYGTCTPEKTCGCVNGYIPNSALACVPGIGGKCTNDADCSAVPGSHCNSYGLCACDDKKVPSSDNSLCLDVAGQFLDPCQETSQCTPLLGENSVCDVSLKCNCTPGHHYVLGFHCFNDVFVPDACSFDGECMGNNSFCMKGYCQCEYGHSLSKESKLCTSGSSLAVILHPMAALLLALFVSLFI